MNSPKKIILNLPLEMRKCNVLLALIRDEFHKKYTTSKMMLTIVPYRDQMDVQYVEQNTLVLNYRDLSETQVQEYIQDLKSLIEVKISDIFDRILA